MQRGRPHGKGRPSGKAASLEAVGVPGRKTWAFVGVAAAALLLVGTALADKEQIHLTAAGQKAAQAAVLTRSDIGTAPGWTRKAKKPDLSSTTGCANFDPKQSDLVLNGAAEVEWSRPGIDFDSEAQVLETPAMVKLDWQRTVLAPQVLPCLRSNFQSHATASEKFVSVTRLAIPAIGTYSRAYRVLLDYTQKGQTVRLFVDVVLVGRGRTEITLTTTAPLAAGTAVKDAELRLVRLLVARAS
jgi:hypothetical protein